MKKVSIYTKTGFKGLKIQNGVAVYILEMKRDKKEPVTLQKTLILQSATANQAALKVVIAALSRMTMACELEIHTDSSYVAAGYNAGWVDTWKANGWKTARGEDVANKTEWQQLDELLKMHEFSFLTWKEHEYREWMEGEVIRAAKEAAERGEEIKAG